MPRRDFTLNAFSRLLSALSDRKFHCFSEFCINSSAQSIVLRHDVDALPKNSLRFAQMQSHLNIRGTFYFRIVPQSLHLGIIEQIVTLGHEIGYHYEDVARTAAAMKAGKERMKDSESFLKKLLEESIESFAFNLAFLRKYADIKTICMHGSPLSPWDSRLLWTRYNYRDFGLIGEPYFDIDFGRVAYYTDTGRHWDGNRSVVRDKPFRPSDPNSSRSGITLLSQKEPVQRNRCFPIYHSTLDIIKAIKEGTFPEMVMFTFHPQRWHDRLIPWTGELIWQNLKNMAKYSLLQLKVREYEFPRR